jgi:thiamine-phosphate pyrophosphorylase
MPSGAAHGSPRERLAAVRLYLIATFPAGDGGHGGGGAEVGSGGAGGSGSADAGPPPGPESPFRRAALPDVLAHPEDLPLDSVRWTWRVADAVRGGAGAVQVRVKAAHGTALRRELLRRLRAALGPGVLLLVNDDLDALVDERGAPLADGVHLGREDAAAHGGLARVRQRLGPALLLGTSTRTLDEVLAARAAGADHAGFGALSGSSTKSDTTLADPAELARALAACPGFPIFPIGGLSPATLATVRSAGARRAAIGSAILDAKDPAAAARACLAALDARA